MKGLKKISCESRELDKVQSNVSDFVKQLTINPFLDGIILSNIYLTTTPNIVNHGLGRAYQGWVIIDKNSDSKVWSSTPNLPNSQIILTASANTVVSIYVF